MSDSDFERQSIHGEPFPHWHIARDSLGPYVKTVHVHVYLRSQFKTAALHKTYCMADSLHRMMCR